jgi:hypothetical protein
MRFLLSASLLFLSALALGQQPCPVPPSLGSVSHSVDMFTDQQEVDLGDAMAEQITQLLISRRWVIALLSICRKIR